jgi:hypothetical protein
MLLSIEHMPNWRQLKSFAWNESRERTSELPFNNNYSTRSLLISKCNFPREAIDRQIELEKKKRKEIEERKREELEEERSKLVAWKQGLDNGKKGEKLDEVNADSDYESGESESGNEAQMADHPDYHGKGWQR